MIETLALYIGIDLGTSGVRACVIDHNKELLHINKAPLIPAKAQANSITQDANLWWQATEKALTELFTLIDTSRIQAICVNGTSGTVLVCDQYGEPLAPARMYNDSLCTEQAELIRKIAPANTAAHGASSGLAKLLYLQKAHPEAAHLLHQADWIAGKLTGHFNISDENNALKTGYDPQHTCWPDWLKQLHVNFDLLPKVVAPGSPIGKVRAERVKQFNLNVNCQVISGTTDSIAAFIATGAYKPGDAVTSLGSTLVLKVVTDKPIYAPELGIYSHKLGDYWLAGGASNSGAAVLAHYFDTQQMQQLTPQLKPKINTQLNYYPLLQKGERFPVNDPNFSPRLEPKPDTDILFFQAMLEGISQIELDGYKKLKQLGAPYPTQVETAGGGSTNPAWTQIRQNMLGIKVTQAEFSEACYGSALLALSAKQTA